MEIKKSPKADLERGKSLSILMGFVVGLAVLFVGFEWSTRDVMVVQASEGVADIIAEEEVQKMQGKFAGVQINQVSGNRTGKRYPRSCNLRIRG